MKKNIIFLYIGMIVVSFGTNLFADNFEDKIVCVTSQEDNLESQIDSFFGRSNFFILANPNTMEYNSIKNPYSDNLGNAGIQAAKLLIEKNIEAVITGKIGPKVHQLFKSEGIEVITEASGTVRNMLEKYNNGEFAFSENMTSTEKDFDIQKFLVILLKKHPRK